MRRMMELSVLKLLEMKLERWKEDEWKGRKEMDDDDDDVWSAD